MIDEALDRLLDHPGSGVSFGAEIPGLRSVRTGKHRVYYIYDAESLFVARVLHGAQDASGQFG